MSAHDQTAPLQPPQEQEVLMRKAIKHPGNVHINVQGAFIVDGAVTPPEKDRERIFGGDGEWMREDKDIRLPNHKSVVSHIAVDIGGSLAKLVYFSYEESSPQAGGRLNFMKFDSDKIDECIEFMKRLQSEFRQRRIGGGGQGTQDSKKQGGRGRTPELSLMATGGGAFKYYDIIKEALGTEVVREDEMECLIIGLDFFITEIPDEVFTYNETEPLSFVPTPAEIYPYLLVNIGSGVSIIKVSGPRQYERVGGTSLGGGTLWGLLSLITGARNFEEMLKMADRGDNTAVDMLVGDIYGTDYSKIGLKSTTIASSFGKVYKMKRQAEREAEDHGGLANGDNHDLDGVHVDGISFKPEDISRSLLYAISNNIGQIAYLHAQKHGLDHIYFGGSFIGGHRQTMNTLSYAIRFWSKGEKKAYFLRHEGYLGAVGAFLKRQPPNWGRRNSIDGGPLARIGSR